ncbi:MAG: alpha/beta fold hydrolase [Planctomycetota bacterium]
MNAATSTFDNPFAAMTNWSMQSALDWGQRMALLPKVARVAAEARKGVTPYDVVHRDSGIVLRRYRSDAPKKFRTPLVCVFALVNRPYILDLLAHKSVIRRFLDRGFDVYLVDWGVPTPADHTRTLYDYIEVYLHRIIDFVRDSTGEKRVSLLGYCMGGTMSSMYVALHPERIRNFIPLLSLWGAEENFDVDKAVDTLGNIPPDWLQGSFLMLNPVQNLFQKYMTFYERMTDEKFLEEFFAMETWLNDNIPVAGETYRDFIKFGYQRNLLVQGKFPLGPHEIDLGAITCPILNLTASADHLVPCGQSTTFNDLVGSEDKDSITFDSGHIGLAVGSRAHRDMWPRVCDWLGARSDPA